ncbi:MAG TPA: tetratricopeptide repeat protein [Candidatus Dormibacteraeota bacterium]|nr:tetratricopeptide repeat protein [Candidatus Dormibacteraeota bacterium]
MASGRTDGSGAADPRPRRRRLPGVSLRPGSVKQARLEAGLSLAQLGKGHVTAPAIYLVETGRTRPSLPTLEHIARRTGKPIEFFLAEPAGGDETQASLIALEAMVAEARYQEAIALGRSLLDRGSSAFRLGRIRYFLAQAHLGLSQLEPAAMLLAEARAHFEAVNDGVMLAECIGAQATIANMTQSKDAVALAEAALKVCRALPTVPALAEARLLATLAAAHMANRDWDQAIAAYEKSIEISGSLFDLRGVARSYGDLATAYYKAGESEAASRYAMRSVAVLEVLRDRAGLARSESSLAGVLMARGDLEGARLHLERSLELSNETDLEAGRSQVLLNLAELSVREGEIDRAHGLATDALELAQRLGEGAVIAEAHVLLGRIADQRGENEVVDREFDAAIHGFEAVGMHERLLQCHGIYAEILERRGELAKAYVHMKEALQASRPGLLRDAKQREKVNSA